jgi:hypothetical protein
MTFVSEMPFSIRDQFAIEILKSLIEKLDTAGDAAGISDALAEDSYKLADALMTERRKNKE